MSSKGAKRSRRVEADGAPAAEVGARRRPRSGEPPSGAAPPAAPAPALVPSPPAAASSGGGAGGALAVGLISAAEVSRLVEERLGGVRGELASLRRDHARLASAHARELGDLRYDNSRLSALLESSSAVTEVGIVCRRHGSGPDEYREYRSVMSVLFNVHAYDLSEGFMRFFTTREARELRLVHGEFRDAVAATPWHDLDTVIDGPLAVWRACFPNAQAANVQWREDLVDADFAYLRGLRALDMSYCRRVSDAAFANLSGIELLDMSGCTQPGVTSKFLAPLKGVAELTLRGFDSHRVSQAAKRLREARVINAGKGVGGSDEMGAAILAEDLLECRRLLATHAPSSACWVYAGVTFDGPTASLSTRAVIAAACLELLRVGLDVGSKFFVVGATLLLQNWCRPEASALSALSRQACIAAGTIPVLVATLGEGGGYGRNRQVRQSVCTTLGHLACSRTGRVACFDGLACEAVVSALKLCADDAEMHASEALELFRTIANMSTDSSVNVVHLVDLGAVPLIARAFQRLFRPPESVCCCFFVHALHSISHFRAGQVACIEAGAVPLLAAAYVSDETPRDRITETLRNLGYNSQGVLLAPEASSEEEEEEEDDE